MLQSGWNKGESERNFFNYFILAPFSNDQKAHSNRFKYLVGSAGLMAVTLFVHPIILLYPMALAAIIAKEWQTTPLNARVTFQAEEQNRNNLRDKVLQGKIGEIAALKLENQALQAQLKKQKSEAGVDSVISHEEFQKEIERNKAEIRKEIERFKSEHKAEKQTLESAIEQLKVQHEREKQDLEKHYVIQVNDLSQKNEKLESQHAHKEKAHAVKLQEKEEGCESKISNLENNYQTKVKDLESQYAHKEEAHAKKLQEKEDNYKIKVEHLESQYASKEEAHAKKLQEKEDNYKSKISELEKKHQIKVEHLESRYASREEEHETELQKKDEYYKNEKAQLEEAWKKENASNKEEHETELQQKDEYYQKEVKDVEEGWKQKTEKLNKDYKHLESKYLLNENKYQNELLRLETNYKNELDKFR